VELAPRALRAAPRVVPRAFYVRSDAVAIAREMLGKVLCARGDDGVVSRGVIVETEAYTGLDDMACHSARFGRTKRTQSMYRPGGGTYVYTCHTQHLFNVIIGDEELPAGVLVRAVEPLSPIDLMLGRRNLDRLLPARLAAGPGMLTKALGIDKRFGDLDLCAGAESESDVGVWLEDVGIDLADSGVLASPRVGIDYAGEAKHYPYRFRVRQSQWTSRAK